MQPTPYPHHQVPVPPSPFAANPPVPYPPAAPVMAPGPSATALANARAAGIAVLVAAAVMVIAAVTKSWFTAGDGKLGLLGLEACHRGACQTISWFDFPAIPKQIPLFATGALIASLLSVAFLLHAGVVLLQGAASKVKLKPLTSLLGLASCATVAFIVSLSMGPQARGLSIGWSAFAGLGGLIAAGFVTAIMVRPLVKE